MITKEQIELAKTLWEQARESALYAHESWRLLMESQKVLLDSYRAAGFPLSEATKQFEKFMADHSERYKAALEHMDKMSNAYGEILEQFKKSST
jgi:hypothetical protein